MDEDIEFIFNENEDEELILEFLSDDTFLQRLENYIKTVLLPAFLNVDNTPLESRISLIKLKEFLNKFSFIFEENIEDNDFIIPDKNSSPFKSDITFATLNEEKACPFKISKLLSLITYVISYMNEHFELNIYQNEHNIKMLRNSLNSSAREQRLILNSELFLYEANHRELLKLYKIIYRTCESYRSYYLSLLYHIDSLSLTEKKIALSYLPTTILNIFSASLVFIEEDDDFLEFINDTTVKDTFIPCYYRIKYMKTIYNMSASNFQVYFEPDIELLIKDIINLFPQYLEDSYYYNDINVLTNIINLYFANDTIDKNILIKYVSIQTYILSRIENERLSVSLEKYTNLLLTHIENINLILSNDSTILKSYLTYYLTTTLNNILSGKSNLLDCLIKPVKNIFSYIVSTDLGLKYMKVISDSYDYLDVKNLSSIVIDDVRDPLTELPIVQKCVINPNQTCDKYMLESYIWIKEENPFTREKLTLSDLDV